jgi:transcriptional regulator with XRE-family HTH domain
MIRSFRELFGMTQVEFAGLAKGNRYGKPRSSSAVSGVEAGKTPVSAPASAAIRDAMGWYA